jgi:hypothetical protein
MFSLSSALDMVICRLCLVSPCLRLMVFADIGMDPPLLMYYYFSVNKFLDFFYCAVSVEVGAFWSSIF